MNIRFELPAVRRILRLAAVILLAVAFVANARAQEEPPSSPVEAGFLKVDDIADFSGNVFSGVLAFEHRTFETFGFGGGYIWREFDLDSGESRLLGNYTLEISGFYIFGRFGF